VVEVPDLGAEDTYYGSGGLDAVSVIAVPEPSLSVLILFGSGVLFFVRYKWKRRLPNKL
jgi:hypothetical protein